MTEARDRERPVVPLPRCPYCHEDVARGESIQVCAVCHAFHHGACWSELGGCAACGAGREPRAGHQVRGVATRAEVRERVQRRTLSRATALRALGVAALLAVGGSTLAWVVNRRSWEKLGREPTSSAGRAPVDSREPREVARAFVDALGGIEDEGPARGASATLRRLSTAATADLFGLTGPTASHEDSPPGETSPGDPRGAEGRTVVDLGGKRYHLVREDGGWKVDLYLAPEWSTVGRGRMRLPAGLPTPQQSNTVQRGEVTFSWQRGILRPFERVVGTDAQTVGIRRRTDETIAGLRVAFVVEEEKHDTRRCAFVEVGPSELCVLTVSGPQRPGVGEVLERLLRASLATYESRGLEAQRLEKLHLERMPVADGFSVLEPPDTSDATVTVTSDLIGVGGAKADDTFREAGAPEILSLEVPDSLLPRRSLARIGASPGSGGQRLVLHATGVIEGRLYHLRAEAPVTKGEAVVASELTAIADSFAREPR